MRILFVVNDIATEVDTATSTILAFGAARRGHEVYMLGLRDLTYDAEAHVGGLAVLASGTGTRTKTTFLKAAQSRDAPRERVRTDDLDVIWLRYNPSEEVGEDSWARDTPILMGQIAMRRGVLVLNHPDSLLFAISKLYTEHFPAELRPPTLITREIEEVRAFHRDVGGRLILKPLMGYGGADVYLVKEDAANLKQLVETLGRQGFIVCQEYLPEAPEGDTRILLVNGEPVVVDGKWSAVRRVNREGDDFRGNMTAGARPEPPEITPRMEEIVEVVGPRLRADGIFFAGIDVVGDKVVEVNAISAGGLNIAGEIQGVDFAPCVIEAIERKLEYRRQYGPDLGNRELAGMR